MSSCTSRRLAPKIRRSEDPKGESKKPGIPALNCLRLPGPRFARLNETRIWNDKHHALQRCLWFQIRVSF